MLRIFEYMSTFGRSVRKTGFKETIRKSRGKARTMRWAALQYLNKVPSSDARAAERAGVLTYRCNICGALNESKLEGLQRESSSCSACGSTVRTRAVIHALSVRLFNRSLCIPEFPVRRDIIGIGMSDCEGYALPLAKKLGYRNTFYHKEPRLDITAPGRGLEGTLDFIISSDVLEHVAPPVSTAFENARKLLKPGGILIFTVPYVKEGVTIEHFPDLHDYKIIRSDRGYTLINRTKNGREQTFNNLSFHGGPGATLEMRVFSESSIMEECSRAGFARTFVIKEPCFEYGIYWHHDTSLPMVAKVRKI